MLRLYDIYYIPISSCEELHDLVLDRHGNKFLFMNEKLYFVATAVENYQRDEMIELEKYIINDYS
jgi:hypothetical protein